MSSNVLVYFQMISCSNEQKECTQILCWRWQVAVSTLIWDCYIHRCTTESSALQFSYIKRQCTTEFAPFSGNHLSDNKRRPLFTKKEVFNKKISHDAQCSFFIPFFMPFYYFYSPWLNIVILLLAMRFIFLDYFFYCNIISRFLLGQ